MVLNKKFLMSVLCLIIFALGAQMASATTYYENALSAALDPYYYGCDYSSSFQSTVTTTVTVNTNYKKVRDKMYRNGTLQTDTSNTSPSGNLYAYVDNSLSSSLKTNTWKHEVNYYYSQDGTVFTLLMTSEDTKTK